MTRVKPGERKRSYNPKVKTGCATCKSRRLKCDETRPACTRCDRAGRPCPGYDSVEVAIPPTPTLPIIPLPAIGTLSQSAWKSDTERRAFQYFRECTAHQFESFWPEDIWSTSISQVAHHEPGIRHAVLALAGFHERYERHDGSTASAKAVAPKNDWALTQYNNAISYLMPGSDGTVDIEVYLLSCVIFTAIESVRGNSASAIQLVRQGVRMLKQAKDSNHDAKAKKPRSSPIPLKAIEAILLRWEIQIQELMSDLFGDDGYEYAYQMEKADEGLPGVTIGNHRNEEKLHFDNVQEARDIQDRYWHGLVSRLNQLDTRNDDQVHEDRANVLGMYSQISHDLDAALEDLAQKTATSNPPPSEVRGLQVIKMWRLVFQASITSDEQDSVQSPLEAPSRMHLSPLDKLLEEIVDLAESLVVNTSHSSNQPDRLPSPVVRSKVWASLSPDDADSPFATDARYRNQSVASTSTNPLAFEIRHDSLASSNISDDNTSTVSEASTPDSSSTSRPTFKRQPSHQIAPTRLAPTFAPDISMLPTLFGSFLRATDISLRRRVIHILQNCRRQEGLWDSRLFAKICERIMELEATGDADRAASSSAAVRHRMRSNSVWTRESSTGAADESCGGGGGGGGGSHSAQATPLFSPHHQEERDYNAAYFGDIQLGAPAPSSQNFHYDDDDDDNDDDDGEDDDDPVSAPEGAVPNQRALGVFRLDLPDRPKSSSEQQQQSQHHHRQHQRHVGRRPSTSAATNKRPAPSWGARTGGRKITGVKIGLAAEGLGRERLRVGFVFDVGQGMKEEGLKQGADGQWELLRGGA